MYECHSLNFAVFHLHIYSLRPIYSQIAHKLKCPTVKTISCRNHNVYSPNNVWMSGHVSISMHQTYMAEYGDLRVCIWYKCGCALHHNTAELFVFTPSYVEATVFKLQINTQSLREFKLVFSLNFNFSAHIHVWCIYRLECTRLSPAW